MRPRSLVAVALAAALALLAACRSKGSPAGIGATQAPTRGVVTIDRALVDEGRVRVAPVERRAPHAELRVAGEVRVGAGAAAEVGALVAGRVASLGAVEGQRVARGQVLAWLDAPEVGHAAADVLRARARATVAARKLARQLDLEKQEATSKNAVDDARAEDQIARADLVAARTLLSTLGGEEPPAGAEAQASLVSVRVPVRSPIAGVVAQRDAALGAPVSPDRTLFRIVGAERATVLARVPETSAEPAPGAVASLHARGGGASCPATVGGSLGVVDEATRTVALRLEPDATCTWLVPGGYVDVAFSTTPAGAAPQLVVPREAIVDVRGVPSVFVVGPMPEQFVLHAVRPGPGAGPEVVVESGVDEGDRVVVAGALLLKGELLRAELEGS